jgi:hypothetical protein
MKRAIIVGISIILMGSSCGNLVDHVYGIDVINNTDYAILTAPGLGPDWLSSYPDTTLSKLEPAFFRVSPHTRNYIGNGDKWENVFPDLPKDTLSIYIFSKDTFNTYGWRKVQEGYKILKRYDLSLDDLKKLNWTVTYPPTEEMKDIRMYPTYKN